MQTDKRKQYSANYRKRHSALINQRNRDHGYSTAYFKKNKEQCYERTRKRRIKHPIQPLLYAAKSRAKKQNIPFNITIKDIIQPTHCPVLGIELIYSYSSKISNKPKPDNVASLDRLIPQMGYVKGNVQVISWRANRIKNDASIEELKALVKYVDSQLFLNIKEYKEDISEGK